ncbi:MAG: M20 family metallopeptidase [Bacteroidia bacterium]|nr:M20 family metallopeptidase [Bacteroidia bacterium]
MLIQEIQQLSLHYFSMVQRIRRHLHQNPELSFEEHETAKYISQELTTMGIAHEVGITGNGIVASISGKTTGTVLALRADIDALPIQEENDVLYRSCVSGKMHACGHDAHTASLLGTIAILNHFKSELSGTIKFIFQPAEERLPGGASLMIQAGVLQNPTVNNIIGQHVMPLIPIGKIGVRKGKYMASADEIYLTIRGKGGHGAQPHTTIDPVTIAAQLIVTLQQVISRIADPRTPSVLTFGKIQAEGSTNIIPEQVYLEGTFRTFDEHWRTQAHQKIKDITYALVGSFGAAADLQIKRGYPVLCNDESLTQSVQQAIEQYVGADNIVNLDLWTASEDFAYYTQVIPGCFYRLGTRNEDKGIIHGLHTPHFDIDEDALKIAPGLMAWIAICQLQANS